MKYSFISRTKIISFCFLLFALVLVAKLFLVQVVYGNSYKERAEGQYATPSSNVFERGTIYFSRKDGTLVSAATQVAGFKLAINPSQITDKELVYEKLSKEVTLDQADFFKKVGKSNDPYEEVLHRMTKAEADAISLLKIPGVNIYKEKWRFYPGGSLASHTLGFLGYKGDELAGRYGLERQYESTLSRNKDNLYVNFFAEVFSNIRKTFFEGEEKDGSLVTTIEPDVQSFLEKELSEVKGKYKIDSIGGIIMNPQDGSIYALGVSPDFNPNNFSKVEKVSTFSNPLVENVFEFGSVVKPLVMAAGLDAGVITAQTKYDDKGSVQVEKKEIFNFDKKARGVVNMEEVLSQSLNTGMVFVYRQLGKDKMRDYMFSFGIKEKTGIDLPNETNGLTSNLNTPRDIEYANASFGQGIALTPIEMVRALAALGNGGKLVTPHVVKSIKYDTFVEKKMTYPEVTTKISKETSEEITRMLVMAMDSYGGGKIKLPHYSVAAKTGTAQIADKLTGGYYTDRNIHSFVGYFPAYNPEFIVFLYGINPKGVEYSSTTWTEPFIDITKFLLNYYEIPPDR